GGHRRRRLADRDHVNAPSGNRRHDVGIERTLDDAPRTDRVNGGASDLDEILSESGNGNRQLTLQLSDQPDRPVTTSNSRNNFATTCSALASSVSRSRSAMIFRRAFSAFWMACALKYSRWACRHL